MKIKRRISKKTFKAEQLSQITTINFKQRKNKDLDELSPQIGKINFDAQVVEGQIISDSEPNFVNKNEQEENFNTICDLGAQVSLINDEDNEENYKAKIDVKPKTKSKWSQYIKKYQKSWESEPKLAGNFLKIKILLYLNNLYL